MKDRFSGRILLWLFLSFMIVQLGVQICQKTVILSLSSELVSIEEMKGRKYQQFRAQKLSETELAALLKTEMRTGWLPGTILTMKYAGFSLMELCNGEKAVLKLCRLRKILNDSNHAGYFRMKQFLGAVWDDLKCFPVLQSGCSYENSWMFERTYGGLRGHEGTDIVPPESVPGYYQICSMTDGIVEQIGWLPLGGYRIGIRSPSGGYFYYAHLDSYARKFQTGEWITAGTILGKMGDSGYGPEGTRGKFTVHLHLGIYLNASEKYEFSINPYWILRYIQCKRNLSTDS